MKGKTERPRERGNAGTRRKESIGSLEFYTSDTGYGPNVDVKKKRTSVIYQYTKSVGQRLTVCDAARHPLHEYIREGK